VNLFNWRLACGWRQTGMPLRETSDYGRGEGDTMVWKN
jgi:hypothetical protein